jgi:hypothetical protein
MITKCPHGSEGHIFEVDDSGDAGNWCRGRRVRKVGAERQNEPDHNFVQSDAGNK